MDRKPRPPRAASFDDTNELNLWKKIVTALTSLDGLHKDAEEVFTSINKLHAIADAEGERTPIKDYVY
ncbi:hypothetical protein BC938DRAFT_475806 [Jimgerdemannia flammicorona]|uniref:Uncharacterized protein n=1 Tax=Jimgerdemannia flammicorona TaxID=994334 RepID=A0A433PNI6_9FUNG|nr:hypothetical protein BC938DRAFT_475806 [Jimgerdemannia flammicorona]